MRRSQSTVSFKDQVKARARGSALHSGHRGTAPNGEGDDLAPLAKHPTIGLSEGAGKLSLTIAQDVAGPPDPPRSPRPIAPISGTPATSVAKRTQRVQWIHRVITVFTSGP